MLHSVCPDACCRHVPCWRRPSSTLAKGAFRLCPAVQLAAGRAPGAGPGRRGAGRGGAAAVLRGHAGRLRRRALRQAGAPAGGAASKAPPRLPAACRLCRVSTWQCIPQLPLLAGPGCGPRRNTPAFAPRAPNPGADPSCRLAGTRTGPTQCGAGGAWTRCAVGRATLDWPCPASSWSAASARRHALAGARGRCNRPPCWPARQCFGAWPAEGCCPIPPSSVHCLHPRSELAPCGTLLGAATASAPADMGAGGELLLLHLAGGRAELSGAFYF